MAPFFAAPQEVSQMAMPLRQSIKVATYLAEQKLRKRDKFPLIVELEPLFACNLKCEGCGKIQHPAGVLKQRMPVAQAVGAVLESGSPPPRPSSTPTPRRPSSRCSTPSTTTSRSTR